jgi:hypothetical protein
MRFKAPNQIQVSPELAVLLAIMLYNTLDVCDELGEQNNAEQCLTSLFVMLTEKHIILPLSRFNIRPE